MAHSEKGSRAMLGIDNNAFIIISAAFGLLCGFLFSLYAQVSQRPSLAYPNGMGMSADGD
jgi:hypothetical protein